ncbi:MAG: archaetidylinositol phosphate synthase [Candidatus Methanosuratincola petrocarbonis]
MVLNRLRGAVSRVTRPIASAVARSGIPPNAITFVGFLVSLVAAYAFYRSAPVLGGLVLLLSGLFDIIDGAVARASGRVTKWGGVLDSVLDRYSDLAVVGAIAISGLCNPVTGIAAMIGSVMVSYVRARGEVEKVGMAAVGLMERAERMVLVSATAILGILDIGMMLLALLTNITVLQRLYHVWRSLS